MNTSELTKELINKFKTLSEVYLVGITGSNRDGNSDEYSDVDLFVCSTDMESTKDAYKKLITEISPIIQISPFFYDLPNVINEIIYLKNFSPYQKIDLTIVPYTGYLPDFNPEMSIVFEKPVDQKESVSTIPALTADMETIDMSLGMYAGFILGFAKSFHRKNISIYRYWTFLKDKVLVLLFEKYFGWSNFYSQSRISAEDQKKLFLNLNQEDRWSLEKIMPISGNLDLVESFKLVVETYLDLTQLKSESLNSSINLEFIDYLKEFVKKEIRR